MDESVLFSVIVLAQANYQWMQDTIKSIAAQTYENYEIIIVEKKLTRQQKMLLKEFSSKITKILNCKKNSPNMVNLAVSNSKGKYFNILFPGDFYLSKFCLKNVYEETKNLPDLIYSPFLFGESNFIPKIMQNSFDLKTLKTGKDITAIQSCFLLKDTFIKLNGFNEKYPIRGDYDYLCTLFKKKNKKIKYINRVLVDFQYQRKPHEVFIRYGIETFLIIFKHFGFFQTLSWAIIYDHFKIVFFWFKSLKRFFSSPENV